MIFEIDESFPSDQFFIDGFSKPYWYDTNFKGGGAIVYLLEDIPVKELKKSNIPNDIETKLTPLQVLSYPPSKNNQHFLKSIRNALDKYSMKRF